MATYYTGNSANVTLPALLNISSSTDATPIVVTTTANHSCDDGDRVEIVDHTVNVNANRVWNVQVVSPTQLRLVGSTATGAGNGGATGTVRILNPRPEYLIPADVDLASAASVNAALENSADREAWIASKTQYTINQVKQTVVSDEAYGNWGSTATGAVSTWTENTVFTSGLGTPNVVNVTSGTYDWLDVYFSSTLRVTAAVDVALCLFVFLADFGVAEAFASATKILGSDVVYPTGYYGPAVLRGLHPVSGFIRGKKAHIYLAARDIVAGAAAYNFFGSRQLISQVYRNLA